MTKLTRTVSSKNPELKVVLLLCRPFSQAHVACQRQWESLTPMGRVWKLMHYLSGTDQEFDRWENQRIWMLVIDIWWQDLMFNACAGCSCLPRQRRLSIHDRVRGPNRRRLLCHLNASRAGMPRQLHVKLSEEIAGISFVGHAVGFPAPRCFSCCSI